MDENLILARCVSGNERMTVLPELFGRHMLRFESLVYCWMGQLVPTYEGGYWEMYRLNNGGFYMALSSKARCVVSVDGNGFEGEMSGDAAGIVACLFALNQMAWTTQDSRFVDLYQALLAYAEGHPEGALIFRAID